jgi:hypothetical protein
VKNSILRARFGIPALVLSAFLGSAVTGIAVANQPHMKNALNALYTAQSELRAANDNKGGHRNNALGYVQSAINETKAGMQYARTY